MCGIVGKISLKQNKTDISEVKKCQKTIAHRGPDGNGFFADGKVTLAMTRLAIIDVIGGDQPLFNEDKKIVIVGNGEIYNFIELRNNLVKNGHRFKSKSDIEIVIHLYEDEGIEGINKIRGMFALALYDQRKHKLFLIRDRMGEKPLYWSRTKTAIYFGSEMKAFTNIKGIDKSLNHRAIDKYFHHYYIPEPETIFNGIIKLLPGKIIEIDTNDLKVNEFTYWNPDEIKTKRKENPTKLVRDRLSDACELCLRSDVPVGIALSGGIDSGLILALLSRKQRQNLIAFSIGYKNVPTTDERWMAKKLADNLGIKFIDKEIDSNDVVKDFPKIIYIKDDPIADIAAYSLYSVCKLAHDNGVKVLLGGVGGDELFWGYKWVTEVTKRNIKNKNILFYEATTGYKAADRLIKKLYQKSFKESLVEPRIDDSRVKIKTLETSGRYSIKRICESWLVSDVITLSDRLSMASGVELRSPFLDYRLVETVLASKKIVKGFLKPYKYYLKKIAKNILPVEVLNRPKRGFTPPVGLWLWTYLNRYSKLLRGGFLVKYKILDPFRLNLILSFWFILPMFWYQIYQLLVLEIWGREYVMGQSPEKITKIAYQNKF